MFDRRRPHAALWCNVSQLTNEVHKLTSLNFPLSSDEDTIRPRNAGLGWTKEKNDNFGKKGPNYQIVLTTLHIFPIQYH